MLEQVLYQRHSLHTLCFAKNGDQEHLLFPSYSSPVQRAVCCRSQAQHRNSTSFSPCPTPSTNRQKGPGAEDPEEVMSTPATSTMVVLSHTCLGYSGFYQILMPTVSKIFHAVYPEEENYILTVHWPQFLWRSRSCFDPQCIAFFIRSSGLGRLNYKIRT